jgi:uracil-DNA glycosylase
VLKSLRRLDIDPLAIYGTLCVKCPLGDPSLADPGCVARLVDEIAIVRPRIVVVMGEDAVGALNEVALPLGRPLDFVTGEVQRLTPAIEAIVTPDIDVSLDEEDAKREFWRAFKVLGDWYADLPPY